jgi:hypothetical protein
VIPVLEPILEQDIALFVSVVTELELLSHPGLTEEDMAEIAQVLMSMVAFPLESRLAQLAGALRRQYRRRRTVLWPRRRCGPARHWSPGISGISKILRRCRSSQSDKKASGTLGGISYTVSALSKKRPFDEHFSDHVASHPGSLFRKSSLQETTRPT